MNSAARVLLIVLIPFGLALSPAATKDERLYFKNVVFLSNDCALMTYLMAQAGEATGYGHLLLSLNSGRVLSCWTDDKAALVYVNDVLMFETGSSLEQITAEYLAKEGFKLNIVDAAGNEVSSLNLGGSTKIVEIGSCFSSYGTLSKKNAITLIKAVGEYPHYEFIEEPVSIQLDRDIAGAQLIKHDENNDISYLRFHTKRDASLKNRESIENWLAVYNWRTRAVQIVSTGSFRPVSISGENLMCINFTGEFYTKVRGFASMTLSDVSNHIIYEPPIDPVDSLEFVFSVSSNRFLLVTDESLCLWDFPKESLESSVHIREVF